MNQIAATDTAVAAVQPNDWNGSGAAHSTGNQTQFISFAIGDDQYGVDIMAVREIKGWSDITHLPKQPEYVRGVINLRGQVIAVVDLRAKFGMEKTERTEHTCIIVVEMVQEGRKLSTGIIVDKVSEVLNIAAENVEDAPAFGCGVKTDFIVGMGKIGQSVKILLDIDRVLSAAEVEHLQSASN